MTTPAPVSRTGATDREVEAAKPTAEHLSTAMKLISKHSTHGAGSRVDFAEAIAHALAEAAAPASESLREFAEFVVSLDDDDPESPGRQTRKTVTLALLIDTARAALLAEQPGGGR